jgi:hypothetical protein
MEILDFTNRLLNGCRIISKGDNMMALKIAKLVLEEQIDLIDEIEEQGDVEGFEGGLRQMKNVIENQLI